MPLRNIDCPKYLKCLDWAVKKNVKMACELGKCDPSRIGLEEPKKEEMKTMDQKKQCLKCGEEKPPEEFSKNVSTSDGLERWCKDCKKRAGREFRRKHRSGGNGRKNRKKRINQDRLPKIDDAILLDQQILKAIKRSVSKEIIKLIEEKFA